MTISTSGATLQVPSLDTAIPSPLGITDVSPTLSHDEASNSYKCCGYRADSQELGPGGTMLDLFGGSGTGAVAALRWGMKSSSIERDSGYVADIVERVKAEPQKLNVKGRG